MFLCARRNRPLIEREMGRSRRRGGANYKTHHLFVNGAAAFVSVAWGTAAAAPFTKTCSGKALRTFGKALKDLAQQRFHMIKTRCVHIEDSRVLTQRCLDTIEPSCMHIEDSCVFIQLCLNTIEPGFNAIESGCVFIQLCFDTIEPGFNAIEPSCVFIQLCLDAIESGCVVIEHRGVFFEHGGVCVHFGLKVVDAEFDQAPVFAFS